MSDQEDEERYDYTELAPPSFRAIVRVQLDLIGGMLSPLSPIMEVISPSNRKCMYLWHLKNDLE